MSTAGQTGVDTQPRRTQLVQSYTQRPAVSLSLELFVCDSIWVYAAGF